MNTNLLNIGKIPPQAIDMEEAVLGALMLEKDSIDKITLRPECFYKDSHQKIFASIQKLAFENKAIDQLTVSEQLKIDGFLEEIGGCYFISQLTSKVANALHIEDHSLIVFDKYVKRELIRISTEIQQNAFDDSQDTFEIVDSLYSQLDFINNQVNDIDEPKTWKELLKEAGNQANERNKLFKEGKVIGIPTALTILTKWLCGWQKQQFILIGGRPGMGKTAFVLANLKKAAEAGYKPCLFSLEMSDVSLANRLIIGESGVDADNFRSGNIFDSDWTQIEKAVKNMWDFNILIDDKPKSINRICAKAKMLHRKKQCDLVMIDYIQLVGDDSQKKNGNREQELSGISRKCKMLAKTLEIPVIALVQLNREVENRPGKRPRLSDIRECGALEQDADVVMFIYRPDKYGITENESGEPYNGCSEIIVEKQREGETGPIKFRFNRSLTTVHDEFYIEHPVSNQTYNPNQSFEPNKKFDEDVF
jgi:replicative DNA helicase